MKWVFCAVICWIVFLLVVDYKRLRVLAVSGFLALIAQLLVDGFAIDEDFYIINDPAIPIFGSSLFFSIGIVFPMGILVAQTTTQVRKWQLANVIAWVFLFTFFEVLAVNFDMMVHVDWSFSLSVVINFMVMVMITWFTEHYLMPRMRSRRRGF